MKNIDPSPESIFNRDSYFARKLNLVHAPWLPPTNILRLHKICLLTYRYCESLDNVYCLNFVKLVGLEQVQLCEKMLPAQLLTFQRISDGQEFQAYLFARGVEVSYEDMRALEQDFVGLVLKVDERFGFIDAHCGSYRFEGQCDTIVEFFGSTTYEEKKQEIALLEKEVNDMEATLVLQAGTLRKFILSPGSDPVGSVPPSLYLSCCKLGLSMTQLKQFVASNLNLEHQGSLLRVLNRQVERLQSRRRHTEEALIAKKQYMCQLKEHRETLRWRWSAAWLLAKMYDPSTELNRWFREIYLRRTPCNAAAFVDRYTFKKENFNFTS